jgi:hypothetical protein
VRLVQICAAALEGRPAGSPLQQRIHTCTNRLWPDLGESMPARQGLTPTGRSNTRRGARNASARVHPAISAEAPGEAPSTARFLIVPKE